MAKEIIYYTVVGIKKGSDVESAIDFMLSELDEEDIQYSPALDAYYGQSDTGRKLLKVLEQNGLLKIYTPPMTIGELIEVLKKRPQDAPVYCMTGRSPYESAPVRDVIDYTGDGMYIITDDEFEEVER